MLLVAAEAMELAGLARRLDAEPLDWPVRFARAAHGGGQRLVMAANGPGPCLAAAVGRIAAEREKLDGVVSVGYCGALDPALKVGDIVTARGVEASDSGERFETCSPLAHRYSAEGCIISLDRFVRTAGEKRRLRASGAVAVEMEAAGVAREARGLGLSFACVRVVTDGSQEGFHIDFNAARDGEGRFRYAKVVSLALHRPWRGLPELIGLYRRSRRASEALGEFLANIEYQF
ncbi:MAG: hypothetical protein HY822_10490 [Acidobacteria bacterium]|nr:hypothetical protein [Acidobacteriota bacterium]